MNDSRDFQDAESIRSGNSHVTSWPVSFPPHPIWKRMVRHSFATPSRREGPPSIWNTMVYRETFLQIQMRLLSAPYPKELNQWNASIEESLHSSTEEKRVKDQNKNEIWDASLDRQPKIQSSSVEGILQIIVGQTNDCRFRIFISTSSPHQRHLLAGRQDSSTCSQFPTEAIQLIKTVEINDSVGYSQIFFINMSYFNAKFWSTRCQDCFSIEQNHP